MCPPPRAVGARAGESSAHRVLGAAPPGWRRRRDLNRRSRGGSAVVRILDALRRREGGEPRHQGARKNPGTGAGREAGREEAVVDLPGDGEAVVAAGEKEDAGVVL